MHCNNQSSTRCRPYGTMHRRRPTFAAPSSFRHVRAVARGTMVATSTEALRTVKDRLSEFVDRVQKQHERVVITRNGTPAAVLISTDDLEALEETLDLLSDKKAVKELREARREVAEGDVIRGVNAVRKLRER